MEKILRIENIEKYYGNKTNLTKAIDNISFDINDGEFVVIMGLVAVVKVLCLIVFLRLIELLVDIFI